MKLESVSIERFRSIENADLPNCGGFNVLIGKNNSGKSNILSAINAFFTCIRRGNVVTLDPPIGRHIDFFQKVADAPINITLAFSLSAGERDALISDIVGEAPQMRNAVDGLEPALRVSATLAVYGPPSDCAVVTKLGLAATPESGSKSRERERILLYLSREAALELRDQLSRTAGRRATAAEIDGLRRYIDSDDWYRIRREREEEGAQRTPLSYLLRRAAPLRAVNQEAFHAYESALAQSTSYEEFQTAVASLVSEMEREAAAIEQQTLANKVSTFAGEESSVPGYARNLLSAISRLNVVHLTERRKPIGKEEAQRLLSLKVRRGGPEVLRGIQDTVRALLGVDIDAFESSPSARGAETAAEMDVDNFLVEANGSGIREALRLVLDVQFGNPQILLVEEPEIHLHPGLETSMMRFLKRISSDCQVFISTHSTNFIDTAEMKNVYLVSKPDSTRIQPLDFEGAESQIPKELGIRLSSLFMFDRLVFVEGPSDEAVLREWASTLNVNLSQSNVGFLAMGGVRNFTHFATEATLSFLTKRQVKMWFLIDRDEKDDMEVAKLEERLGANAAMKVIQRRQLENYLLCPRAVAEFVMAKRRLSSPGNATDEPPPAESDVKQTMAQCADALRQLTVNKRAARILCRPVYPSVRHVVDDPEQGPVVAAIESELDTRMADLQQAKAKAHQVYEEQSKAVNRIWRSDKFVIVPGDLLLDAVCQQYGVRFKKEGDGARLAGLMLGSEIDDEMSTFLHEIAS